LLIAAACFLGAVSAGRALAQDPRASAAQKAALSWLALADAGNSTGSWQAAGKLFQNAITSDQWGDALKKVRPPLGAAVERSMLSTQFTTTFQGAPDGEYALLVFRTSFANKTDSRETVTLVREPDGVWRVIGYYIR
jgi:hypothetical protein